MVTLSVLDEMPTLPSACSSMPALNGDSLVKDGRCCASCALHEVASNAVSENSEPAACTALRRERVGRLAVVLTSFLTHSPSRSLRHAARPPLRLRPDSARRAWPAPPDTCETRLGVQLSVWTRACTRAPGSGAPLRLCSLRRYRRGDGSRDGARARLAPRRAPRGGVAGRTIGPTRSRGAARAEGLWRAGTDLPD